MNQYRDDGALDPEVAIHAMARSVVFVCSCAEQINELLA